MKLSDTQRAILQAAAEHPRHMAIPPDRLPAGARQKVADALVKNNLVLPIDSVVDVAANWTLPGGAKVLLKITDDGFRAIGIDPNPQGAIEEPGEPDCSGIEGSVPDEGLAEDLALLDQALAERAATPRASLRDAATAVLAAWDDEANRETDIIGALDGPMQALRAALAGTAPRATRATGAPRKPREGTKQDAVLALLRRPEGATVAQISEATTWAAHTVRGFFAGLKKKGIQVEAIERVRMVGPNKEGARGSYTVYQVKGEG